MEEIKEIEETNEAHSPDSIRLEDSEIRLGISLNMQALELQTRLEILRENGSAFEAQLRAKYGVSQEYRLEDYITGFERVQGG